MLQHLRIQNLALMDEAEMAFEEGFHTVTGETGAGKSVLLGALAILSGNRVEKTIIRRGADACRVEASLYVTGKRGDAIASWLQAHELPECEEDTLVLSRTVYAKKAARILINGRMATATSLRALGELWIDFHGPGEPQKLMHEAFQLRMVDLYGNYAQVFSTYQSAYQKWCEHEQRIAELREQEHLDEDALQYLQVQLNKLQSFELSEDTIEALENDYQRMSQAQDIAQAAAACREALAGDSGASSALSDALRAAAELAEIETTGDALEGRLNSLILEIEDLATEYRNLVDAVDFHPSEVEEVQQRMQLWMDLKRKYGGDLESVIAHRDKIERQIGDQGDIEGRLIELEAASKQSLELARSAAKALTDARKTAAKNLQTEVVSVLKTLGFKKAELSIQLRPAKTLGEQGGDRVEFLFSANPGSDPLPLSQIASSGEMARVMLALKTILARYDGTPVLVFDEVDANVGGEIGKAVGERLKHLAESHQVFCITHLPQVAAKGTHHWCVTKQQSEEDTSIRIHTIAGDRKARLSELARMMGDRSSETALKHAEDLLA